MRRPAAGLSQSAYGSGTRRPMPDSGHPAVFLDKDGTLIHNVPYNVDPSLIRMMPGVPEGLLLLHQAGYRLFVVTNQSGIARGYFSEAALGAVAARLGTLFAEAGAPLAGFYYCPHHIDGVIPDYATACDCRKPAPGMLHRAAHEHRLNLARSWFIGDILDDIEAGHRAGCRSLLVDTGGETEWVAGPPRNPDCTVRDFAEAARWIARTTPAGPASVAQARGGSRL